MITFNSNNIIVGEIKELLSSYNLPYCKVLVEGDKISIYKKHTYIYKDSLLVAIKDKTFNDGFKFEDNDFEFISFYKENLPLLNITHKMPIRNVYYDSFSHQALGNYLRFQRDYNGIDLMSLYNCFSGLTAKGVEIPVKEKDKTLTFSSYDTNFKIYVVPVKFWKSYKIYFESSIGFSVVCALYKDYNVVSLYDASHTENYTEKFYNATYVKYNHSRFSNPIIYDKLLNVMDGLKDPSLFYDKENELCLFIKVPFSNNSSLVVIEDSLERHNTTSEFGITEQFKNISYRWGILSTTKRLITNDVALKDGEEKDYNQYINDGKYTFIGRSQLTYINDNKQHPFADRLIEYLVKNTIDTREDITLNIKRVVDNLYKKHLLDGYTNEIEWSDKLKNTIYVNSLSTIKDSNGSAVVSLGIYDKCFDILGYVDKDVESGIVGEYDYSNTWEE